MSVASDQKSEEPLLVVYADLNSLRLPEQKTCIATLLELMQEVE